MGGQVVYVEMAQQRTMESADLPGLNIVNCDSHTRASGAQKVLQRQVFGELGALRICHDCLDKIEFVRAPKVVMGKNACEGIAQHRDEARVLWQDRTKVIVIIVTAKESILGKLRWIDVGRLPRIIIESINLLLGEVGFESDTKRGRRATDGRRDVACSHRAD